ncbi:G2/Mitotic-specific cyclin A [Handroanthus impetiginosus]|uniref:G2/Mitotic-specific cyclin A n=1 Tax=Handroanthus impetiginosus TaxID=429701 RepID=A0A2G9FYN9_9LAMI|nr:G2/Mitotic-specific cyclin A [Handroanthus impetiginosus]
METAPCMVSQTTKNLESLYIRNLLTEVPSLEMKEREDSTRSKLPRTIKSFVCRKPVEWYRQNPPPGFKPLSFSKIIDIDANVKDPLMCPDIAADLFENLYWLEVEKRPRRDYMEKVQKHINPQTRAYCIDWVVDAADKLNLFRDTLHLAVNYMDRYLSGNEVDHKTLQLVGMTCMMIASKYQEVRQCHIDFDSYIYLTRGMFTRDDLKSKWRARFMRAAQAGKKSPSQRLECMASYLIELSLLSYQMVQFLPSMVAASAVFLAQHILFPGEQPWNATLQHYTHYKPSDLCRCVLALNESCYESCSRSLPTIRFKYSQPRYHYVALKGFPVTIFDPIDEFRCSSRLIYVAETLPRGNSMKYAQQAEPI